MNIAYVIRQLGLLMISLSATLVVIGLWSLFEWQARGVASEAPAVYAFAVTAGVGIAVGGLMWIFTRGTSQFLGRREALLLVGSTWIIGAAIAALPFLLWAHLGVPDGTTHIFDDFVDCYFEAMSGLTTTGATVLTDIEALPRSVLLWRALTHWLGGLGIVVLFVAVLPTIGVGAKKMFRVETTGPSQEGVLPTIRDTARVLLYIYLGLTAGAMLLLWVFTPMDFFDSLCHAFSALSTGGFSTRNTSIAAYDSMAIDYICAFFMLLAGVNFAVYFKMTQGKFDGIWRDTELRVYMILKVLVIAIVFVSLRNAAGGIATIVPNEAPPPAWQEAANDVPQALRYGTFVGISMQTGTGFCTGNYEVWPVLSQIMLVGLVFIGGSAGSTAGGVKVVRFWIAAKVMIAELERSFRPNVVRPLKLGRSTIDDDVKLGAIVYILIFGVLTTIGAFTIGVFEPRDTGFMTGATASLSCISNVGPGLGGVGPADNFGHFTSASKIVMSILMALGRLELFAIMVLFTPRFWKGD